MIGNRRKSTNIVLSVAIALLILWFSSLLPHPIHYQEVAIGDVGPPLIGFERVIEGQSPFNLSTNHGQIVAYPFTTSLILSPFLLLPLSLVAPIFLACSTGLLAYAMIKTKRPWQLLTLISMPFFSSLHSVQWSPLVMASIMLPSFLPITIAKPQLALATLATGAWTRRTIAVSIAIVVLSLIIYPSWIIDYLHQGSLGIYPGKAPFLIGPGFLLLLASVFWRDSNGRLLLAMALIPQRIWYDQLLLFLIPRSWRSVLLLVAFSWITALATPNWRSLISLGEQDPRAWVTVIWLLYLPALGVLFWERRNYLADKFRRSYDRFIGNR